MKLTYQVKPGCVVEAEVKDVKQVFQFAAYADSVFGKRCCGNCESTNQHLSHKNTKEGYDYYSIICDSCGYEFKFGQALEGGRLFPKGWEPPFRKGEDGGDEKKTNKREDRETVGAGASKNDIPW